jgi:hypothetical protein
MARWVLWIGSIDAEIVSIRGLGAQVGVRIPLYSGSAERARKVVSFVLPAQPTSAPAGMLGGLAGPGSLGESSARGLGFTTGKAAAQNDDYGWLKYRATGSAGR